ncbi:MAG: hypothetical protein K0B02_03170 [DPANN group archaeon]|nr:hypothetical protein [DPANN group archaeon]
MRDDIIYILDSTVFIENYASQFMDYACVTVYDVIEELINPNAKIMLDMFVKAGLTVIEPDISHITKIKETVKKTGDKLSVTDIKVIALALQFKSKDKNCSVVSDDYGIQNVAKLLDIDFLPVSQEGIKKTLIWKKRCTACGKINDRDICGFCGSETKFYSKKAKK